LSLTIPDLLAAALGVGGGGGGGDGEDGGDEKGPLRSLADMHSPHCDTSSTSDSRRYGSSSWAAATLPPNSLIARKVFLTRMKHIPGRSHPCTPPHAFRAAVPATAAEASLTEASYAFRATMTADAAARAPDVTSAQGGWEEEPREEGGATEKKEATLHPPDSRPFCFCKRFLLFFFFGWDIGILPPSIVPCHSRSAPSDMRTSLSFPARGRARGAPSAAITLYPLAPAHIAPLMCSTTHQKLVRQLFPTAAHLPPIALMVLTYLLFQLLNSCRRFTTSAPSLAARS
jgi:hypothetical protein